jgi:sugar-specific transcriptional regulator TrmB
VTEGISPAIYDTLRQLGLTEYGARCYVALLSLKSGDAAAIAEAAEVPRTKVYGVLRDLADDGWIVAGSGRPAIYRPVSPDERIAAAEKRIAEGVAGATRELQARFSAGAPMTPASMYMIRGRALIKAKSVEVISRAREELLLNLSHLFDDEKPAILEALRRAKTRGVQVRILIGPGIEGFSEFAPRRAIFPFHGIVCDWRQALIMLPQGDAEPMAMWNPTQAFVEAMRPALTGAWKSAAPV